jgi:outer membrane murein-binding lipoprotein Lpp
VRTVAIALAALTIAGCSKNIQTKEAIRQAIVDYLASRQGQTGLDMNAMNVEVVNISFQADSARARVAFNLKNGGGGMEMSYDLDRKGNQWVVRGGRATGKGSAILPPNHPSIEGGGGAPGGQLPPGHPPVGGSKE